MSKKVFINLKLLFFALLLTGQFSCRDAGPERVDYEFVLVADSAANSFLGHDRLDIFMQLSSDIIKARLENYGFTAEDYVLEVEENRLKIKVHKLVQDSAGVEDRSFEPVRLLATSQGSFRIYETYEGVDSRLFFFKLDSAMKADDTAQSVYDYIFIPEYYEDGEVIYHPTPVAGFVPLVDTGNFFRMMRQYRAGAFLPEKLQFIPLRRNQKNLTGLVAISTRYSDSSLVLLDQSYVKNVAVSKDGSQSVFKIELNETGTQNFTFLSLDNENRTLAIVLDSEVLFYPKLTGPITDGILQFSSDMPFPVAKAMAVVINLKQLPLNLRVVQEDVVRDNSM